MEIPIVKSPTYIKVKAGDTLDNGLVVKSAYHSVVTTHEKVEESTLPLDTEVEFEGKLTLSGVLYCHSGGNEYFGGAGNLFFFVDPPQSDPVPMTSGYEFFGRFEDRTDKFAAVYDAPILHLGNINDLSVDLSEIIDLGESVKVRITMEDVCIGYSNTLAKSINGTIVSVEPVI